MAICGRCTTTIQNIYSQEEQNPQSRERKINVTLPRYRRSSIRKCWVCRKFAEWLETETSGVFKAWRRKSIQVEFASFGSIHVKRPEKCRLLASVLVEISPRGQNRDINGMGCEVGLDFVTTEEFGKSQLMASTWRRSSSIDIVLVRSWLHECTTHHEKCKEIVSAPWYPTRLVYLGPLAGDVKLIISEHSALNGPYMTLSHRWGPQTYEKLQSSTMAQLQNSIDLVSLPQVFQDAIELARLLGIKYLWIDALCIKQDQDDLSDWEVESQKMSKVYSRAILNVAATLSQDGSESLFKQEPWGPIFPSEVELTVDGLLQKYYVFDSNIWNDEIANAPLNQRGWVFQERVLARRVLHFGQCQMGWECNELEALEIFPSGLPTPNSLSFMNKSSTSAMMAAPPGGLIQPLHNISFIQERQNLVNSYSKCKLTYSKDKLIAFDGIAKSIMSTGTHRYIAGMWEYGLLYDLAWRRDTADREAFPISATLSRAPSWSWASVDGEISFPPLIGGVKAVFADIQGFSDPSLEECSAFGAPSSIRAKGLCFTVDIEWLNEEEIASFEVMGHHFFANDEHDEPFCSTIDYEVSVREFRELVQQGTVLLMPLFATGYFMNAILLSKTRGNSSYRRLGAVEIELVKEREEENAQMARPQPLEALESESYIDQNNAGKNMWNKAAVDFIGSIVDQRNSSYIIDIL